MQKAKSAFSSWTGYLGLILGLVLIVVLFNSIDLERSLELIASIGFRSVFILLPFFGLHFFETLAWVQTFPPGTSGIRFWILMKIQVISETVSMTLPAGVAVGEPLRPYLCNRQMQIEVPVAVASTAVRKLLLGAMQGVYTVIGALAGFMLLQKVSTSLIGFPGLGWLMLAIGIGVFVLFMFFLLVILNGSSARTLHRMLMMVPFKRVQAWLLERESGFHDTDQHLSRFSGSSLKSLMKATFWYLVGWIMLALESYIILRLLGVEISFSQVLAIDTTLVMLRAIFFFIPSGLGIQDLGYLAFFQAIGIPDAMAYGGAFILLRRFKEVLWYSSGYLVMFLSGVHLRDAGPLVEEVR
ncbi:lysylphosphatidylglycerol synthase transmembrane domain-containing protein [Chlorobium sp. N1]|uniref:lysylphosphatidylglycerol synthase transmembrane domain-containing protein n=1 Tax=Chlorobium sp. N1 TaxID=2491138 RepID=UPI001040645E|nr:lysylphosphatidylglycerol synthase transmembrane domain-containing protein [Chlorobium sp. N1]TCD48354.1 flippase-like domain-containing protein [Chlorobium sp. N1]